MTNTLFIITGPSGVGKTTVGLALLKQMPNMHRVVTYTTRQPRPNEKNGIDYNFIKVEEFLNRKDKGDFFEHAEVYDNYYGNSREDLEKIWKSNNVALMIVDVQGAKTIRTVFPQAKVIFILPDNNENLAKRMKQRPMNNEAFTQRWAAVQEELNYADMCDFTVINEEGAISKTVQEIKKYIIDFLK
ncbi:guanylate kinase [Candidatus Falkowbacteria bacterium]|nr:guanylate kinase [Candidatus Falkowbacteria bacterium]